MLSINTNPPPEILRSELAYDPKSGLFAWLTPKRGRHPDRPAGNLDKSGYMVIVFEGRTYRAHRLAWWLTHDHWPVELVDHRNGKPADNRLSNLRLASPSQNSSNRKLSEKNKTGYRGVKLHHKSGRWNAEIGTGAKRVWIGSYATAFEAAQAYDEAAIRLKGEFASLNFPVKSPMRAAAGIEPGGRLVRSKYRKREAVAA